MTYSKMAFQFHQKSINKICWAALLLFLTSCIPSIQYLGDSYQRTEKVDVYYDEGDVKKEFKTMGKMTHDKIFDYEVDKIKEAMIEKAKEKGADGIIFLEVENMPTHDDLDGDRLSITAKLIRYT